MTSAYRQGPAQHRASNPAALAQALQESRRDTLATFACYETALAGVGMAVPYSAELNPPLWELGHVGWFQDWWLARYPQRTLGWEADPDAPRRPSRRPLADELFDSSQVPHASRWQLALPSARALRQDLADGLTDSLALLQQSEDNPTALYFHRLCLMHEDMHHEAAIYMAQALGIALDDPRWLTQALPAPGSPIELPAGPWSLGSEPAEGFAFDNELGRHRVNLPACTIDAQVLRWMDYLPFVEAGGYRDSRWWPGPAGLWRQAQPQTNAPRYLRREDGVWQHCHQGVWQTLDLALPACHLTAYEAQAYCLWAGRRLPREAEWERAALTAAPAFHWGQVWEWTASTFGPYPGFVPHPYRDYSAPWFGSRQVLRGASAATQPRMHHPRYRNFFTPERSDILAGFRTCAL
jgi:iron(II)-dependent oxidoreductase